MISLEMKFYLSVMMFTLIGNIVYLCIIYPQLPDTIPLHINAKGEVNRNRQGAKWTLILLVAVQWLATFAILLTMKCFRTKPNDTEKLQLKKELATFMAMSFSILTCQSTIGLAEIAQEHLTSRTEMIIALVLAGLTIIGIISYGIRIRNLSNRKNEEGTLFKQTMEELL